MLSPFSSKRSAIPLPYENRRAVKDVLKPITDELNLVAHRMGAADVWSGSSRSVTPQSPSCRVVACRFPCWLSFCFHPGLVFQQPGTIPHILGRASFRLALLSVRRIVLSCGLFVPGKCVLCAEHDSQYCLLSTMWPASFRQLG